jgi:hypothetical protein
MGFLQLVDVPRKYPNLTSGQRLAHQGTDIAIHPPETILHPLRNWARHRKIRTASRKPLTRKRGKGMKIVHEGYSICASME